MGIKLLDSGEKDTMESMLNALWGCTFYVPPVMRSCFDWEFIEGVLSRSPGPKLPSESQGSFIFAPASELP